MILTYDDIEIHISKSEVCAHVGMLPLGPVPERIESMRSGNSSSIGACWMRSSSICWSAVSFNLAGVLLDDAVT